MPRWMLATIAGFLVVYAATVIISGEAEFLLAALLLVLLLGAIFGINAVLRRRVLARHDSLGDAMSDETDNVPSTHIIPDDVTDAGDTPEAHDEISPHDLPLDHPGRQEAERQALASAGERTTEGHADPSESGGERR